MERDPYYSDIRLHLNYTLKIKNDSVISLFDVELKLKVQVPFQMSIGSCWRGRNSVLIGETHVSHKTALGNIMRSE